MLTLLDAEPATVMAGRTPRLTCCPLFGGQASLHGRFRRKLSRGRTTLMERISRRSCGVTVGVKGFIHLLLSHKVINAKSLQPFFILSQAGCVALPRKVKQEHEHDSLDDPADYTHPYRAPCAFIIKRLPHRNHHSYQHPNRSHKKNDPCQPRDDSKYSN